MKKILIIAAILFVSISIGLARPSVAVVLSGGGAMGFAHIGVLANLEKYGIPIDRVYGTSMGALMGGMYCAGYTPKEIEDFCTSRPLMPLFTKIQQSGYSNPLDPAETDNPSMLGISPSRGFGDGSALLDDYLIMRIFDEAVGNIPIDVDFDSLPVSFRANGFNVLDGSEYIFDHGDIRTAMRASMSMPVIFNPVEMADGAVLMDGGLYSNLMVHKAVDDGFDIIIAVDLPRDYSPMTKDSYKSVSSSLLNMFWVLQRNTIVDEIDAADFNISADVSGYDVMDFDKVVEITQCGYRTDETYRGVYEAIAACFEPDQLEFKDPLRKGLYSSSFTPVVNDDRLSGASVEVISNLDESRISFGFGSFNSLSSAFGNKDDIRFRTSLMPVLSFSAFRHSMDNNMDLFVNADFRIMQDSDVELGILYNLAEAGDLKVYLETSVASGFGSLSVNTDKSRLHRFDSSTEFSVFPSVGIKVSDGVSNNFEFFVAAANYWISCADGQKNSHFFNPYSELGFAFLRDGGKYRDFSSRFDFKCDFGYVFPADSSEGKGINYNLTVSSSNRIGVSPRLYVQLDSRCFSAWSAVADPASSNFLLRDDYGVYGGWNGVAGYLHTDRFTQFASFGAGVGYRFNDYVADSFVLISVSGGFRSRFGSADGFSSNVGERSVIPFADAFSSDGCFDLGGSVGVGFKTPIGDVVLGYGMNKDLRSAVYFEIK